jgi:hypothetical protein
MDRRLALKQLAWITGGVVLIPSCDFSQESVLEAYEKLQVTDSQRETLKQVTNTVFPGVKLKKGEEVGLPDFVLIMANDCLPESEQGQFLKGLRGFDSFSKKEFGKTFGKMETAESAEAYRSIMAMEEAENSDLASIKAFLGITKRFALQGYLTSEYYLTEIMPYKMIPGGFKGSKLVSELERINPNG